MTLLAARAIALLLLGCIACGRTTASPEYGQCMQACGMGCNALSATITQCSIDCQNRCSLEDAVREASSGSRAPAPPEPEEPAYPLAASHVVTIQGAWEVFSPLYRDDDLYPAVVGLDRIGQRLIQCLYQAPRGFEIYYFWYEKAPPGPLMVEYIHRAKKHQLDLVGVKGLAACPPTSRAALAQQKHNIAEVHAIEK